MFDKVVNLLIYCPNISRYIIIRKNYNKAITLLEITQTWEFGEKQIKNDESCWGRKMIVILVAQAVSQLPGMKKVVGSIPTWAVIFSFSFFILYLYLSSPNNLPYKVLYTFLFQMICKSIEVLIHV